ncbi:MAG: HAMP domain-containing histidine kinase [Oligoflexia bacterium]|nr:HAMP domain-containing histidine kinase [Oligoflexia bacterium]
MSSKIFNWKYKDQKTNEELAEERDRSNIYSFLKNSRFRTGIEDKSSIHPLLISIVITLVYVVLISIYIWFSSTYASNVSSTKIELEQIELTKGLFFVLVTGLILFISFYLMFRKMKIKDEIIITQNKSIILSEGTITSGIFSMSVCHDIGNLLNIIVGNASMLGMTNNLTASEKENISAIYLASENIKELLQRMMDAGKGRVPNQKVFVDLTMIVKEIICFAKFHNKIKKCNIRQDVPVNLRVNINTLLFSMALMNMILNSAEACNNSGEILIKLKQQDSIVSLEVHDNGPGISDETKKKIFNPFFTTKLNGNGLGLLSLKIFTDQCNGKIEITKSELGGACFSISFPTSLNQKL